MSQQKQNRVAHHGDKGLVGSFIVVLLVWGPDSTVTSEFVCDKLCCSNFKGLVSMASGTSPVIPCGSVRPAVQSFPPPWSLCPLASHSHVLPLPAPGGWGYGLLTRKLSSCPDCSSHSVIEQQTPRSTLLCLTPPAEFTQTRPFPSSVATSLQIHFLREAWPNPWVTGGGIDQEERQGWNLVAEEGRGADPHHLLTFKWKDHITSVFYKAVHRFEDIKYP